MLPTPVRLEMLPDGANWRLLEDVRWIDAVGRIWLAPAGLITDLASIPRYLWTLVGSPGTGRYRAAGVLHDAAYKAQNAVKADADLMLRECSIACGCPPWLADLIYEGVHVGGESSFVDDQALTAKIDAAVNGALTPAV